LGAAAWLGKPFDLCAITELMASIQAPAEKLWTKHQESSGAKVELRYEDATHAASDAGFRVGRGGMFLGHFRDFMQKGKQLSFRLIVGESSSDVIEGVGIVRWTRSEGAQLPAGCGIEFQFLSPRSKAEVQRLIDLNNPIPFIPKAAAG
jgi:hypothetical protein